MEQTELVKELLNLDIELRLVESLSVIIILSLLRWLLSRLIEQYVQNIHDRYRWRKSSTYVFGFLAVILITPLWFNQMHSLATFLGLVSAGIAIAMRDPISNLFGWGFILWRRPFEVGDRIQIGEHSGDVVDIRIFEFTMLEIGNWVDADQSTGRILHVPNGQLFDKVLANYSKGFDYIWNELKIHLTFESDWEKAQTLLQQIANEHIAPLSQDADEHVRNATKRYLIVYSKLTPIVYIRVEQNGILLTLRYLCEPRRRRSCEQMIWEHVLRTFAKHADIEFAYPTQRFYQRPSETPLNPRPQPFPYHNNGVDEKPY